MTRDEQVASLRAKVAERLAAKRAGRESPKFVEPRYDDVYYEGVRWLDSLADGDSATAVPDIAGLARHEGGAA